ncbi:MAG: ribonuclease P protein component [Candidatus Delongbacteria bacterium]|nr:ribonuclease P protein component [Candidatus Delongbacteria bacterium]
MKENSLRRNLILKNKNDITQILRNGTRFENDSLRIIVLKRTEESNFKVAFLVSKKLGRRAVTRNKIKRWMREIFRCNKAKLPDSHHIILTATKRYDQINFKGFNQDLMEIISSEKYNNYINKTLPEAHITNEKK